MKAHWCVLVSCPYFQSLYNSGMTEKQAGIVHISIGKVSAVRAAITFLYTGTIQLNYGIVKDILEVADYLQIDDLKSACTSYLMAVDINIQNCVHLCLLASLYDLDIYNKVFDYIRGHLPEVMEQEDTLSLTADSVLEMLQDKSLNYVAVSDFYKFIVKWVEYDKKNRQAHFESLFCELDLKRVPQDFLESTVEKSDYVVNSDKCKVHVLNVKMKHMAGLLPDETNTDVILVVGGCGMGQLFHSFFAVPFLPISDIISINHVYGYIISENRWTELAPLPFSMRRPLVAFCNSTNCLYVYDASTGAIIDDNEAYMFKYSVTEKSWTTIHMTLPEPFRDITIQQILMVNNRMYIVASGRSVGTKSATIPQWMVYLFRVSTDMQNCNVVIPLCARNAKTDVSTCVVEDRYVAVLCSKCGAGGTSRQRTRNVRFFIMDTKTMKQQEHSRGVRHEPYMFAIKNEVFLTKQGCCRYQKFDISTKRWSSGKDILIPHPLEEPGRSDFIYTTYHNELYVFGGKSGKNLLSSACKYNLDLRKWETLEEAPKAITNSGVVMAKIPSQLVRCHIDCPHCKYMSVRSQATYQIDYPDDDGDEDEDLSYDDDDMYSDFMYDDYENIPDYDWF